MAFTIRRPSCGDAGQIADLHVSTWREAYAHLLPDGFFNDEHLCMRREMWDHILGSPQDEWSVRVAEQDDELIGFAMAGPSSGAPDDYLPRKRQLYNIYVSQSSHGSGAGQALLDSALRGGAAMLWVAKQNPRAIAFYSRNGFTFDGAEQTDPGAPRIVDARMVR